MIDIKKNWFELKNKPLSKKEKEKLYIVYNPITKLTKIGITVNIDRRIQELENSSGISLILSMYIVLEKGVDESAGYIEKFLHDNFKEKRKRGEWFKLSLKDFAVIRSFLYAIDGLYIYDYNLQKK